MTAGQRSTAIFTMLGAAVVGAAAGRVGYLGALQALESERATARLRRDIGPWQSMKDMTGFTNPFYAAQIAKIGPFPNPPSEALYLLARTDSEGTALRADLAYHVTGRQLPARFWSIACYDDKGLFFDNELRLSSVTNRTAIVDEGGEFKLTVGPVGEGSWLPTNGSGALQLLLRLYEPQADAFARLSTDVLPTITPVQA